MTTRRRAPPPRPAPRRTKGTAERTQQIAVYITPEAHHALNVRVTQTAADDQGEVVEAALRVLLGLPEFTR